MVKMGNNGPQQRADLARDLSWGAAAGNLRVGAAAGGRGGIDPVVPPCGCSLPCFAEPQWPNREFFTRVKWIFSPCC